MMGRFENFDACLIEQTGLGHDSESANKICGAIKDRAEKGTLYKAEPDGMQILSKAQEKDIVLGGYASWELPDDQRDIFTTTAQVKALTQFLKQSPEWQSVTVNHKEFKLAQPMLKYVDSEGTEYFSHVNEKGTYLISKLRNDNLETTKFYREKALKGELNGYSVTAHPIGDPLVVKASDGLTANQYSDMEYHSITITQKGVMKPVNAMSRDVKPISKALTKCDCDTTVCGGACCTFITMPLQTDSADAKAYLDLHGLAYKADGHGGLYIKFPVACKAFDPETKLCAQHESRPGICKAYPVHESPFIEKAKCSLLTMKMKGQNELEKATRTSEKPLDIESILKNHGFTHG